MVGDGSSLPEPAASRSPGATAHRRSSSAWTAATRSCSASPRNTATASAPAPTTTMWEQASTRSRLPPEPCPRTSAGVPSSSSGFVPVGCSSEPRESAAAGWSGPRGATTWAARVPVPGGADRCSTTSTRAQHAPAPSRTLCPAPLIGARTPATTSATAAPTITQRAAKRDMSPSHQVRTAQRWSATGSVEKSPTARGRTARRCRRGHHARRGSGDRARSGGSIRRCAGPPMPLPENRSETHRSSPSRPSSRWVFDTDLPGSCTVSRSSYRSPGCGRGRRPSRPVPCTPSRSPVLKCRTNGARVGVFATMRVSSTSSSSGASAPAFDSDGLAARERQRGSGRSRDRGQRRSAGAHRAVVADGAEDGTVTEPGTGGIEVRGTADASGSPTGAACARRARRPEPDCSTPARTGSSPCSSCAASSSALFSSALFSSALGLVGAVSSEPLSSDSSASSAVPDVAMPSDPSVPSDTWVPSDPWVSSEPSAAQSGRVIGRGMTGPVKAAVTAGRTAPHSPQKMSSGSSRLPQTWQMVVSCMPGVTSGAGRGGRRSMSGSTTAVSPGCGGDTTAGWPSAALVSDAATITSSRSGSEPGKACCASCGSCPSCGSDAGAAAPCSATGSAGAPGTGGTTGSDGVSAAGVPRPTHQDGPAGAAGGAVAAGGAHTGGAVSAVCGGATGCCAVCSGPGVAASRTGAAGVAGRPGAGAMRVRSGSSASRGSDG